MEININCDLGESSKLHSTKNDPLLLEIVNSANIACGYHAGDKPTMEKTIEIAKKHNVSIGAHPSFNDPENFGRKRLNLPLSEIKKLVIDQINILATYVHIYHNPSCYFQQYSHRELNQDFLRTNLMLYIHKQFLLLSQLNHIVGILVF